MRTNCTPLIAVFNKNPTRKGFFELRSPKEFQFSYLVISASKADYLKKVGANAVCNCWIRKTKVLHTGLIECYKNWFYGNDIINSIKKRFIVIRYLPEKEELVFYLFQNYYPRQPLEFARKFIYEILVKEKAT